MDRNEESGRKIKLLNFSCFFGQKNRSSQKPVLLLGDLLEMYVLGVESGPILTGTST